MRQALDRPYLGAEELDDAALHDLDLLHPAATTRSLFCSRGHREGIEDNWLGTAAGCRCGCLVRGVRSARAGPQECVNIWLASRRRCAAAGAGEGAAGAAQAAGEQGGLSAFEAGYLHAATAMGMRGGEGTPPASSYGGPPRSGPEGWSPQQ